MNYSVVKEINRLQVEKAELKTALTEAKLNEDYADDAEDIKKDIASLDNDILSLAAHLKDEEYVIEEKEEDTIEEEE